MEWKYIEDENDIQVLMDSFGRFHDSCIKELKYVSGGYVDENLGMFPINTKRIVNIVFQRQHKDTSVIEMQFEGIQELSLEPNGEEYDCIIFGAILNKIDSIYYWADNENFKVNDVENYTGTWISALKVKWRVLDNFLGNTEVYTMKSKV